jgi:hypothetical protein
MLKEFPPIRLPASNAIPTRPAQQIPPYDPIAPKKVCTARPPPSFRAANLPACLSIPPEIPCAPIGHVFSETHESRNQFNLAYPQTRLNMQARLTVSRSQRAGQFIIVDCFLHTAVGGLMFFRLIVSYGVQGCGVAGRPLGFPAVRAGEMHGCGATL